MKRLVTLTAVLLACNAGIAGCNGDKDGDRTGETGETPGETFNVLGDDTNLPPSALKAIWGTSSSDVFIVGADDGNGPLALHWDGTAWTRIDTSAYPGGLWWIWSDGGDTVWMSGDGARVLTYSRASGSITGETVISQFPQYTLFGIWGTSPTDIWSVGGDISQGLPGAIFHYDGTDWVEPGDAPPSDRAVNAPNNPANPDSTRQAFKVWGSGADDVWVVGTGALVMHWDGAAWTDAGQPVYNTSVLTTVHGTGPDDVLAVGGPGNARVAYHDGAAWAEVSPPPADIVPPLNGVFGTAEHGFVTCGEYGAVYWFDEGTWTVDPRPVATARSFHACWLDENGDVWAVGGDLTNQDEGVIIYGGDLEIPKIEL